MTFSIGIPSFRKHDYLLLSAKYAIMSFAESARTEGNLILVYGDYYMNKDKYTLIEPYLKGFINAYIPRKKKKLNLFTIKHEENLGLPRSINDIFNLAFNELNSKHVMIIGDDVFIPNYYIKDLEFALDFLGADWVGGVDFTPKYENPYNRISDDFIYESVKKLETKYVYDSYEAPSYYPVEDIGNYKIIGDSFNAHIFSDRLFERVGYLDCHFYPNGYFSDNDFARRAQLMSLRMYKVKSAKYLHLWSRTIYNVPDGKKVNDFYFPIIKKYYIEKWGGEPGKERFTQPRCSKSFKSTCRDGIMEFDPHQENVIKKMKSLLKEKTRYD